MFFESWLQETLNTCIIYFIKNYFIKIHAETILARGVYLVYVVLNDYMKKGGLYTIYSSGWGLPTILCDLVCMVYYCSNRYWYKIELITF